MNSGAFGENFPYSNFHDLNMDWIIKIAKDFLDQYTHIQEVIQTGLEDLAESRETGLEDLAESRATGLAELNQKTLDGLADLQEKYDTLNGLLQAWYNTHSADIAEQLADAIADFNASAEAKSQALLDSWPADYSELVTGYNTLKRAFEQVTGNPIIPVNYINKYIDTSGSTANVSNIQTTTNGNQLSIVQCQAGDIFYINSRGANAGRAWAFLDEPNESGVSNVIAKAGQSTTYEQIIIAPEDSYYLIINNLDNTRISYKNNLATDRIGIVDDRISAFTQNMSITPENDYVTLYPTQGYINENSGAVVPLNGYNVHYFTVPADGWFYFNTMPESGVYTTCCICNDTFGSGKTDYRANSRDDLPSVNDPIYVVKGNVIEICILTNGTFDVKCTSIRQVDPRNLPPVEPYLEVEPVDSGEFNVYVHENKHWYRYNFDRKTTVTTIDGVDITTQDCWDVSIYNENAEKIMQGNFNFIHNLAEPVGHTGYVGAGDGCAVMEWFTFYADGKPFIPGTTTNKIQCKEFRYITKLKQYLSDGTRTTGTIPSLDGEGNPIIESYNTMDCRITNEGVHGRNRLLIEIDGVKFSECHGAMLTGYYPHFDNIVILNKEMTWNKVVDDGETLDIVPQGGSLIDLSQNGGYKKGDTAIIYGNNIIASCTMRNIVLGNVNKSNFRIWLPPNVDNRVKAYMMPVVTTHSAENITDGETVDVFNTGDVIDVEYKKVIRYYEILK